MVSLIKESTFFRCKFQSARDSAIYGASLDTNWSGDSEAPTGWFASVTINADGLRDMVASEFYWQSDIRLADMVEAREEFGDLIGNFLVTGTSSGAIYVEEFNTTEELTARYEALEAEYLAWADADEEDA